MSKETILVIEDEEDILELINHHLIKQGYVVQTALSGEEGLRQVRTSKPELILLDLMLPGVDGLEVCRQIRSDPHMQHIPIIMVTAKGEESDIVVGLELGADDYVTKPFVPKVLLARVRAVLRRKAKSTKSDQSPLKIDALTIHPGRHEVLVNNRKIDLTFTEFRILHLLARRPGWVFTRGQIMDAVRGEDYQVTERSVDVHIVSLRKKLGTHGKHIETVRGVGYRFKE